MFDSPLRTAEGWYPDPSGRLLLRYWDGNEWTLETRGNDSWTDVSGETTGPLLTPTPETGWGAVAFALHSALLSTRPAEVSISFSAHNVLRVNTLAHVYTWDQDTAELPAIDTPAGITFAPSPSAEATGRSLDGLLWRISAAAFPDRLAPWLQSDDLYRMQRWPNLTTINPELDDMRQAAMLANGMFTVDELAGFSDRSFTATRALINALSLMNTLKVATLRGSVSFAPQQAFGMPPAPAHSVQQQAANIPAQLPAQAPAKQGLFQRLRSRLGL